MQQLQVVTGVQHAALITDMVSSAYSDSTATAWSGDSALSYTVTLSRKRSV